MGCEKEDLNPTLQITEMQSTYKGTLSDVYFMDKSTGFIVGKYNFSGNKKSTILRTEDGGKSWYTTTFNLPDTRVSTITGWGSRLFITTVKTIPYEVNTEDKVYLSEDKGISWKSMDNTPFGFLYFLNEKKMVIKQMNSTLQNRRRRWQLDKSLSRAINARYTKYTVPR